MAEMVNCPLPLPFWERERERGRATNKEKCY